MRVRSEITRAIIFLEPRQPKTRPFLRHVDFDDEKPFIVAKGNIVTRPVFLDQFAFEQNRLRFAADGVRFEIPDRVEHGARLQIGLRQFRRQKIGADAFSQIARFARRKSRD